MSETTATTVFNPRDRMKLGSIGLPVPQVDLRIVDVKDINRDVSIGEEGELWVKTPSSGLGYWNNPEETALAFTPDGWFRTGDVAYMDEDYYIFIVDRTKDMIIAGGYNIYPRDIDEVLFKHPKVKDSITIGIPDDYRGETVKSFVQLVEGAEITEKELIDYCRQFLAAYKVPRMIEFRAEQPRSAVGKALRRMLRDEETAKK
jgi:acyl-CoA synthetase (AMP-forming)/AMP-acid ligase II